MTHKACGSMVQASTVTTAKEGFKDTVTLVIWCQTCKRYLDELECEQ